MADLSPGPMPPPTQPGSPHRTALQTLGSILARHRFSLFALAAFVLVTAGVQFGMGRSPLGPDGKFGLWEGNIWSSACSQRMADPYSFSHVAHGLLFYAGLWLLMRRRLPLRHRFAVALALEAGWEILENSPIIINRYREATMALGYEGDSILNSSSDILMMVAGFVLARQLRPWMSVALLVLMEAGCAWWIRDNLTLNIIMLLHPIDAIKAWQTAGQPRI